jgi:hypothetical protein
MVTHIACMLCVAELASWDDGRRDVNGGDVQQSQQRPADVRHEIPHDKER